MKYFAPSTGGFYDTELHGKNIPSDAVSLTDEEYNHLLNNQTSDTYIGVENGKVIFKPIIRTQEEIDNAYKEKRRYEYPMATDQLDMLWHMMDDEVLPGKGSEWYNKILEVKTKYPKP